MVEENTSSFFSGIISMIRPNQSWVAKWNGVSGKPGLYAIKVNEPFEMTETYEREARNQFSGKKRRGSHFEEDEDEGQYSVESDE
jgi:hypothetical protein